MLTACTLPHAGDLSEFGAADSWAVRHGVTLLCRGRRLNETPVSPSPSVILGRHRREAGRCSGSRWAARRSL